MKAYELAAENKGMREEIERLRHDIERHIRIASELATECERLRAELAECRDAIAGILAVVGDSSGVCGYHLNGDAAEWGEFPEVDALIDIARKGEGE